MNPASVIQLYPPPHRELPLGGLYLDHDLVHADRPDAPFVYGNFVCSLDGRVAVDNPNAGRKTAPPAITNPRDWRLFQELAAMADALIVGAAFLRRIPAGRESEKLPVGAAPEFADLRDWRRKRGMPEQPAVAVLTRHPDPVLAARCMRLGRRVLFATGRSAAPEAVAAVEQTGARVLFAGDRERVNGRMLIDGLAQAGFRRIYSMAGPGVLHALIADRVLDRIYLTHSHRMLGGRSFDTLIEGDPLIPPASFVPHTLYYDSGESDGFSQFFGAYELR